MVAMVNKSETYVFEICTKSFLSLWSYANPIGKKGKELCDILIVCGNDIVVISVKDIKLPDSGDTGTDWERWRKRAIEGSVKQIYGAERWLQANDAVIQNDGTKGLSLPSVNEQNIYRIAVAFGGEGQMPLYYGDFGKGFIHVLDEQAFNTLLDELDTISDFLGYLKAKEEYFLGGGYILFEGQEEDLLALYLKFGRCFPKEPDLLVVGNNLWESFSNSVEYKAKKDEDQISYLWDTIIETHIRGIVEGYAYFSPGLLEAEPAIRELALEDRYWRRVLSKTLLEFLELARANKIRSRIALSTERKTGYVLLPASPDEGPDARLTELAARCWVARDQAQDYATIVGIAVGEFKPGYPLDLFYLCKPTWTEEDKKKAEEARQELVVSQSGIEG